MDGLITYERPKAKLPTMLVSFAGWPDAAEGATRAVRYLVEKLSAKKFASIDPEEFYDFTVVRPQTEVDNGGERVVTWPGNDFYYHATEKRSRGLLLYVGTEPNLKWRTFSEILAGIAEQCGVKLVITLGALLDEVPHTREPYVTGRASSPELAQKAEWLGVRDSAYQGPTGIHSAFMNACHGKGMSVVGLWGHSPHYVNTSPNPMVVTALLERARYLVDFEVDLDEMREAGEAFQVEVTRAIADQSDMRTYVKRLEKRYDTARAPSGEIPNPDDMVRELEEFLRSQQQDSDEDGG